MSTKDPQKKHPNPAELNPAFGFPASQDSTYLIGEVLGVIGGRRPLS